MHQAKHAVGSESEDKRPTDWLPTQPKVVTRLAFVAIAAVGVCLMVLAGAAKEEALWRVVTRDLGLVLCPVGLVTLLLHESAQRDYFNAIGKLVSDILDAHAATRPERPICIHDWSITDLHRTRDEVNLGKFFSDASHEIGILTPNLSSLTGHVKMLAEKAAGGVRVRVLALTPDSLFVDYRYEELERGTAEEFRKELAGALGTFKREASKVGVLARDSSGLFEVKEFDRLPTVVIFRSDHRLLLNFILSSGSGRQNLQVEFDMTGRSGRKSTADCFARHFEEIWESPTLSHRGGRARSRGRA